MMITHDMINRQINTAALHAIISCTLQLQDLFSQIRTFAHTQARTAGLLLCSCGTSELKQCKQRDVVCGCYEAVWEFGGIAPFVV